MGIYFDGTTIYVHNDADTTGGHSAGNPHTFAEIAAACPAQFISNGTNAPSYRSTATVQIGDKSGGTIDASGTAADTTTLADTVNSTVIWDNTKTLATRSTQLTSWFLNFGTKVGTGTVASGKNGTTLIFGATTTVRGTWTAYGGTLKTTTGTITFSMQSGSELMNVLAQNAATTGTNILSANMRTLYNVDFSVSTTALGMSAWVADSAERITICGTSPTAFLQLAAAGQTLKDAAFFGGPTSSDLRWTAGSVARHHIVRPVWSGAGPKFSFAGSPTTPSLENSTLEYWLFHTKVVNELGAGLASIPVKVTDAFGNVAVDTLTDANGEIAFGSGLLANAVGVLDHYAVDLNYAIRHRSPFTFEYNTGPFADNRYRSKTYLSDWPGAATVTTTAGTFRDVNDIVPLTLNDVPMYEDIPLAAEGVQRIEAEVVR